MVLAPQHLREINKIRMTSTMKNVCLSAFLTVLCGTAHLISGASGPAPQLFLLSLARCSDVGEFEFDTGGEFPGANGSLHVSVCRNWKKNSHKLMLTQTHFKNMT